MRSLTQIQILMRKFKRIWVEPSVNSNFQACKVERELSNWQVPWLWRTVPWVPSARSAKLVGLSPPCALMTWVRPRNSKHVENLKKLLTNSKIWGTPYSETRRMLLLLTRRTSFWDQSLTSSTTPSAWVSSTNCLKCTKRGLDNSRPRGSRQKALLANNSGNATTLETIVMCLCPSSLNMLQPVLNTCKERPEPNSKTQIWKRTSGFQLTWSLPARSRMI